MGKNTLFDGPPSSEKFGLISMMSLKGSVDTKYICLLDGG